MTFLVHVVTAGVFRANIMLLRLLLCICRQYSLMAWSSLNQSNKLKISCSNFKSQKNESNIQYTNILLLPGSELCCDIDEK